MTDVRDKRSQARHTASSDQPEAYSLQAVVCAARAAWILQILDIVCFRASVHARAPTTDFSEAVRGFQLLGWCEQTLALIGGGWVDFASEAAAPCCE